MKEDEQLVAEVLKGCDAAFDELVERYQSRLLRFLVTRSSSRADAEDALQDTFMNAYRYLASFNPKWRFSTWIYRIAIRELARQSRPATSQEDGSAVTTVDPLAACIAAGERENLWLTARRILSADMYTAVWLHYAEDLPVKQVAVVLGRSLPWVKVALFRSRNRLQKTLRDGAQGKAESEVYG